MGTLGLLQSKVHVSFFFFPFLYTEKFNTGIWLKDAILCDLIAFLMCCCFSFSFSKHTLDDICLSLVFKSVLNSVTFDNCGRFWKCAKQKIMYGSSFSHTKRKHVLQALTTGHIGISWLQTEKKFPWHWVQSEAAVFHWQWLTGLVWKDVVLCVCKIWTQWLHNTYI